MVKTCIIALGPSRCGKGTLARVAESQGYEEIHPIQDLKNFLEELLDLPIGGLHNDFKNTKISQFTSTFFTFEKLYPKVRAFFTKHFSFLNPDSNRYILNWITYEYTNFLVYSKWEFAKDIEVASYHYFKDRDVFFPFDYFINTLEQKKDNLLIFTGVRALNEAEIISRYINISNIIVAFIHRPNYSGISTDALVIDIYYFFKSLNIPCFHLYNNNTLASFETDCKFFVNRSKIGDIPSLSPYF